MAEVEHLCERLKAEGEKTAAYFQNLSGQQWECEVYGDGSRWSVRQLLAHFVATEAAFMRLINDIAAGGTGASEDFDIDAYNERKVASLNSAAPEELRQQFIRLRQETVRVVAGLQEGDLARTGRHPFLGIASLEDIVKLIYRHNQIHLRDLRRVLTGG